MSRLVELCERLIIDRPVEISDVRMEKSVELVSQRAPNIYRTLILAAVWFFHFFFIMKLFTLSATKGTEGVQYS